MEEPPHNDPPASPAAGTCYLVGEDPTGEWSQHAGCVAAFGSGGWRFIAPTAGLVLLVKTTGTFATYGVNGWQVGTVAGSRLVLDGIQVVGSQGSAIANPAGGATIDSEARAALDQVLAVLREHGLIATS